MAIKEILLSQLISELRERANSDDLPVWSVSNQFGFTLPSQIFNKTIASKDTKNYKKVLPKGFAYNPSRINIGSLALNSTQETGIVSPMYVVFKINNTNILDPHYLLRFLKSPRGHSLIKHNVRGGVRFQLKFDDLARIKIPLPALSEQKRIVSLLEEAEELKRKRAEADQKMERVIPAIFNQMFGDSNMWKSKWETKTIKDLVDMVSGGTPTKTTEAYWSTSGTPWVSAKDMKSDFISDSIDHITAEALSQGRAKLIPAGSVLIVVRGMILAHTLPISLNTVDLTINQDLKALIPKDIEGVFLWGSLQSVRGQLLARVKTAAHGTKKLNTDDLLRVEIPIQDIKLQKQFADKVKDVLALQAKQKESAYKIDRLFSSLLVTTST